MSILQSFITMTVFLPVVVCGVGVRPEMNTVSLLPKTELLDVSRAIQRNNGVWQKISSGFSVGVPGSIAVASIGVNQTNGLVYFGGSFLEAGGDTDCNNIAQWDGGVLSPLGLGLDGGVLAVEVMPNGEVYVGGSFTDVTGGPGGTYSYIARWDGSSWNAVGAGLNGIVQDIKFNPHDGLLYICGQFTDVAGGPGGTMPYICTWDGSSFGTLGVGLGAAALKLAVDPVGDVYVCGLFDDIADASLSAAKLAKWDKTAAAWTQVNTKGLAVALQSLAVGPDGTVFVSGDFSEIGGTTALRIAQYNGSSWLPLAGGLSSMARSIHVVALDEIYVGGDFTAVDARLADQVAMWDGKTWKHLDIDLPGAAVVLAVNRFRSGNIMYFGFNTAGTAYTSGDADVLSTVVMNEGAITYPRIVITRAGGTSATIEGIRNLTTGEAIIMDYALQDGETITIDLMGARKVITSSAFGNVLETLNALESNFSTLHLARGDNVIKAFVPDVGSPTITAYIQWETHYAGTDGAAQ